MSVALVTGSAGLIGSETCRWFHDRGFDVVGIDNDLRSWLFGDDASTVPTRKALEQGLSRYTHHATDIRDDSGLERLFRSYGDAISVVVHTAAQPSHDWAAQNPHVDFAVNASGTLNLLELTRLHCPDAVFIFTSTNKVYGDRPNELPFVEHDTRWEIDPSHPYSVGIDEGMPIDRTTHSLFGVSKVAADLLVQEYGRYFGMKTTCFRGGCLTGPAHAGTQLHGFLAYLMKCAVTGTAYRVFGYKGKQVRDNIHSHDLVSAFWEVYQNPRVGEVYNIGGSRYSNCSMLEAIHLAERISGRQMAWSYDERHRVGDHVWYISDVRRFQAHYPEWKYRYRLEEILEEIRDAWSHPSRSDR